MSTLEVNTINPQSGNDVTIGGSSKNVKLFYIQNYTDEKKK